MGMEELGTKGVVVGVEIIEMINEVLQILYVRSRKSWLLLGYCYSP